VGEHLLDVQRVRGSNPLASTISYLRSWRNWIAHLIPIQKVAGSSPVERAMVLRCGVVAQMEERYAGSVEAEGSSPFSSTIITKKTVEEIDFLFSFHTHITMIVYDVYVQGRI
jgi:hypothetical protein